MFLKEILYRNAVQNNVVNRFQYAKSSDGSSKRANQNTSENTTNTSRSKADRIQVLFKMYRAMVLPKIPPGTCYQKMTVSLCSSKKYRRKTQPKSLLEKRYWKGSSSKCLPNNCHTNRLPKKPSTHEIQRSWYSMCCLEKYCENAVQNTVSSRYEKIHVEALVKKTAQKCWPKHR